jgi:hypothetical protein
MPATVQCELPSPRCQKVGRASRQAQDTELTPKSHPGTRANIGWAVAKKVKRWRSNSGTLKADARRPALAHQADRCLSKKLLHASEAALRARKLYLENIVEQDENG